MSTIWSVPVGILLTAALFIFLINRSRQNIGAAWFAAIFAGISVWGWTVSLYFRPDIQIKPLAESVPGLLEDAGVFLTSGDGRFVLDGVSYTYMLAISALLAILLLTAPSYMEPQTAPRIWFFYLLIEAIGYLAVSTNKLTFVIYGWVIFDAIDLLTHYLQVRPGQIRRGFVTAVGIRFVGTLMAAASLALSNSELGTASGAFISLNGGAYLLTACALRMGIMPVSQPYGQMDSSRVGLGTMLRLVSVLTVMPIMSRIPLGGLRPDLRFFLGVAAVLSGLTGAVGWILSENSFIGISYAALGICGLAFVCALSGQQVSLVAWGVSIALTCAPLSLFRIHNRFMNLLGFLVILCFSGLPFTPNAFGWVGLAATPSLFQNIVIIFIPLLLIAGAIIHILQTEGRKFSDLEPWMRSVYPLGFVTSVGTHVFIGMTQFPEAFSLGVIPASVSAVLGGILLAAAALRMPERVKTQNAAAWGRAAMSVFWQGMQRLMNMEWFLIFGGWCSRIIKQISLAVSSVLGENGGLVWEFLLLALLIAVAFSGEVL